jgi:hypothetical protein
MLSREIPILSRDAKKYNRTRSILTRWVKIFGEQKWGWLTLVVSQHLGVHAFT